MTQIREWFKETASRDRETLDAFCKAFLRKNTEKIEQIFGDYLWNTISIRDTAVAKERKENFYHGILLGLFAYMDDNVESGIGYSDILIEDQENRIGIVIEVKYADDGDMQATCMDAVRQIERKHYEAKLKEDGMRTIIKYGMACYKKDCRVILGD